MKKIAIITSIVLVLLIGYILSFNLKSKVRDSNPQTESTSSTFANEIIDFNSKNSTENYYGSSGLWKVNYQISKLNNVYDIIVQFEFIGPEKGPDTINVQIRDFDGYTGGGVATRSKSYNTYFILYHKEKSEINKKNDIETKIIWENKQVVIKLDKL